MASTKQGAKPLLRYAQCTRQVNSTSVRAFSSTPTPHEAVEQQQTSTSSSPYLDPNLAYTPKLERKLTRTQHVTPVGSRRRRAALRSTSNIPFEQLPYQCFQEARKVLAVDREEKIKAIEQQRARLERLKVQEVAPQGEWQKGQRIASMSRHLEELKIYADINDPVVKKKFEDGKGDMNKPIYRYLADKQWRQYKRKLLLQRVTQMNVIPDVLPSLDPVVNVDLAFGKRAVQPGDFVDSRVSEIPARLDVQVYDKGERLITVAVVNPDVPNVEKDGFDYRCHFLACNIKVSPTVTSVPLHLLSADSQVVLPWLPAYGQKGAPYNRMSVFVMEQKDGQEINVADLKQRAQRHGFILRSFVDRHALKPVGVNLFRSQHDEGTAGVMQRAGVPGHDVEFKRKKIEPLPYKKLPDYIQHLRLHIAKGRRQDALSSRHRHLDRSAFWRSEFGRVSEVLVQQQNEAFELKQENDALRAQLKAAQNAVAVTPERSRKRKKPATELDKSVQKKAKIAVPANPTAQEVANSLAQDSEALGGNRSGLQAMRSLYQLHNFYYKAFRPEPNAVAYHLIHTVTALAKVLQETFHPQDASPEPCANPAINEHRASSSSAYLKHAVTQKEEAVVTAITRAFMSLLHGLKVVARRETATTAGTIFSGVSIGEKTYQGAVVYHYASFLQSVVTTMAEIAKADAKSLLISNDLSGQNTTPSPTKSTRFPKKTKSSAARSNTPFATGLSKDTVSIAPSHPTLALLTRLLSTIVESLDPVVSAHNHVFEGYLYLLMQKLGQNLYLFTFGNTRGDDLEAEIRNTTLGTDSAPLPKAESGSHEAEVSVVTAKFLAPYLIALLRRCLPAASSHLSTATNTSSKQKTGQPPVTADKALLSHAALTRLQRTLVRDVFGPDPSSPHRKNCLRFPVLPSVDIAFPGSATSNSAQDLEMQPAQGKKTKGKGKKAEERSVNDWFREELWTLLGWEILGEEIDWAKI